MKKTAVLGVLAAAVMVQAAGPVRVDRMLSPVMPTEAELPGYSTWSIESHVTARADYPYSPVREKMTVEFRKSLDGPGLTVNSFVFESYQQALLWETHMFHAEPIKLDVQPGEALDGLGIGDRSTLHYQRDCETGRLGRLEALVMVKGKVLTSVRWSKERQPAPTEDLKAMLRSVASRVEAVGLGDKEGGMRFRLDREMGQRAVALLTHPRYRVEQPD